MKNIVRAIPVPLQHTILVRLGLALLCLIATACLLIQSFQLMVAVPFLLASVMLLGHAVYIAWLSAKGRCLELKGTVLNVERSIFRSKPKALLVEVQGTALRVVLHNRLKVPAVGDSVLIYISDTVPLYEWRGMHQLDSYLTLVVEQTSSVPPPAQ